MKVFIRMGCGCEFTEWDGVNQPHCIEHDNYDVVYVKAPAPTITAVGIDPTHDMGPLVTHAK